LTKAERQALKRLKTDENIVILSAYKERLTVVMDKLRQTIMTKWTHLLTTNRPVFLFFIF